MTTLFRRRQSALQRLHVSFLNLTLVEWICLLFAVLAMTVER